MSADCVSIPWCSGYHICLTRRRSPVRSWAESAFVPFVFGVVPTTACPIGRWLAGAHRQVGSVAERSKALVSGTSLHSGGVGSNPTAARIFFFSFFLFFPPFYLFFFTFSAPIATGQPSWGGKRQARDDRDRTRTCNLRIRSPTPYPLGHTVSCALTMPGFRQGAAGRGGRRLAVAKRSPPPGGVEPPTFRLTAERANHCATEAGAAGRRTCVVVKKRQLSEDTTTRQANKPKLHRPGIEPGPPAWQASILPLNHRCRCRRSASSGTTIEPGSGPSGDVAVASGGACGRSLRRRGAAKERSAARGHPGLNRGPLDLQSNALPLSYTPSVRRGHAAPRPVEGPRQSVPQNTSENYVA